ESYDADGRLNRAYVAAKVFGDDANVKRINAIVHPRVYAAFEAAKAQAAAEGIPLLVKEAALIFETGGDAHLDAVAVVDAPVADRVRRVVARDGVTEEQVRARMAHQLPAEELRRRADFILENTGTPAALRAEVERVFRQMTAPSESPDAL
ncbi:MAG: dephospho-CoA kinase, partial [Rhodobacteraceae bacterium]|nr:dephospho-CoA kinase [Paracoccaceae bacterium]